MEDKTISRRQLLKSLVVGVTTVAAAKGARLFGQEECGLTPEQAEGPFYPVQDQLDKDWDLTQVKGKNGKPVGQVVYVQGTVRNEACEPLEDAFVEIWQACYSGKYKHPSDTSGNKLDPNFQYWGRAWTGADGRYVFKTVVPGHYINDPTWTRPPHIHYKVYRKGYYDLTTQMYFDPSTFDFNPKVTPEFIEKLNRLDKLLAQVPKADRERVIVKFAPATPPDFELGSKIGTFDITMRKI